MIKKITRVLEKIGQSRYLIAVRDGIGMTMPLIIVSSFLLLFAYIPLPESWGITIWFRANAELFLMPYRMTMFIMSIYIVVGVGASLAKSRELDPTVGSIIALVGYFLSIVPMFIATPMFVSDIGWVIPTTNLGATGIFSGIIIAIFAVEVLFLCQKIKLTKIIPKDAPPAVASSFEAVIPTIIVVMTMMLLTQVFNIDIHAIIGIIFNPISTGINSIFGVWAIILMITLTWSLGIHGAGVIGMLARPFWLTLQYQNTAAYALGEIIPNIAPEAIFQWFIWIGGSGATIGLAILLLLMSRSKANKSLGKISILPAIFNINEPIIFGAPIVMNPILIVPFVLAPLVNATIAYLALYVGWIDRFVNVQIWTMPGPLGAFLATGGDYRAFILSVLLIISSMIIYYPFFRKYDSTLFRKETAK